MVNQEEKKGSVRRPSCMGECHVWYVQEGGRTALVEIEEEYVRIDGLQGYLDGVSNSSRDGFFLSGATIGATARQRAGSPRRAGSRISATSTSTATSSRTCSWSGRRRPSSGWRATRAWRGLNRAWRGLNRAWPGLHRAWPGPERGLNASQDGAARPGYPPRSWRATPSACGACARGCPASTVWPSPSRAASTPPSCSTRRTRRSASARWG